jgi:hypothetical protein
MMYSDANVRATEYARRRNLSIEKQLGSGIQGVVFSTHDGTAIKALIRSEFYARERNAYLRLRTLGIGKIAGFNVPHLFDFHDELLVIEMQIVTPPYVVDFASAYLDSPPPYANDPEIMGTWEEDKREQFEKQWPTVRRVMAAFQSHGIYLSDIKPGNIEFAT